MLKMKRIISSVSIISVLFFCVLPANAQTVTSGQFSLQPTTRDLQIINSQPAPPAVQAWTIGLDGTKQMVTPISNDELLGKVTHTDTSSISGAQPNFTQDYGTYIDSYVWQFYTQSYYNYDQYHFYQGECSFSNKTLNNVTLTYTQEQSNTSTWQVTGKVEVEAEFSVEILAKLTADVSVTVAKTSTSQTGETIGATITVQPGYEGYISRYKAGAQSGGAGEWEEYKVVKATGEVTNLGYYAESGSAYGIVPTDNHWQGWVTKL